MKRLLSLALAAALLAALALPAAAEEAQEAQDARLAKVTALVKGALDLDTEAYESFRGSLTEDLVPQWDLSWEGENRSLSISALEDGAVVRFYRWESDPTPDQSRSAFPTFPETAEAADRAAAEDFLARVLRDGERVELEREENGGLSLGSSGSAWSGTLVLNGLPSSLHYSIRVENGLVEHFDRDAPETAAVGGVPSPDASVPRDQAGASLKETLKLNLEYVFETPGESRAVLRYVPEAGAHEFLVDARTGERMDLTELEERMRRSYRSASGGNGAPTDKAEMAADEAGLTQAELEGVQTLEGVLSKEELDQALRAESAYGLRGYSLTSFAYQPRSKDSGETGVDCELRYTRSENGERLRRNITVDAKTGAVRAVWSSAPYGRGAKLTEDQAREQAEVYLKALCPDRAPAFYSAPDSQAVPLREKKDPSYLFRFARRENGIFFPANLYEVSIDASDGSVYGLSVTWDEDVTFQDPKGVVSPEAALEAWAGTYETALAYRSVPRKLSKADPVQAKLLERDQEYSYALLLTYGLEREESYTGVDAKTGRPLRDSRESAPLAYTDLAGSPAKADIEKLAAYGVGFRADQFRPGRTITQWELVCLAYSLQNTALDPEEEERRESAYYSAYRLGLLRPAERNDGAVLTRGDVTRMLLDAAGYGPAARLGSIYRCGYEDVASIPAEELGYAALAQALGLASGTYGGGRAATRGEAASMLCRVLERAF